MSLCDYGCGHAAEFVTTSGRKSCSKSPSGCPAIKEKNSKGLKKAYADGRKRIGWTEEHRSRSVESRRNSSAERLFVENSTATNDTVRTLLFEHYDVKHECQNCRISEWQGVSIPLELDHINGKSRDNRIENLRLLCPNCHSITPTWRGKNKNTGKAKVTDKEILTAFENCSNIRQTLIEVGLAPKGGNYARVKKLLAKK